MYKTPASYRIRGALGWTGSIGVGGLEEIPVFCWTYGDPAGDWGNAGRHISSGVVDMGARSGGLSVGECRGVVSRVLVAVVCGIVAFATIASNASAQQRREREPNSVYAA